MHCGITFFFCACVLPASPMIPPALGGWGLRLGPCCPTSLGDLLTTNESGLPALDRPSGQWTDRIPEFQSTAWPCPSTRGAHPVEVPCSLLTHLSCPLSALMWGTVPCPFLHKLDGPPAHPGLNSDGSNCHTAHLRPPLADCLVPSLSSCHRAWVPQASSLRSLDQR